MAARSSWAALAAALVLTLGACQQDSYSVVSYPEAGPDSGLPDGLIKFDGWRTETGSDANADGCVKSPAGEICDGKDNDCNGKVDDVPASQLQTSLKHCGKCNNTCNIANAYAKCVAGACQIDACAAGYHDLNGKAGDGCEYACVTSNGGTEDCDGLDNDCDGTIDEGFDLLTSLKHCGACYNQCGFANAAASCAAGKCQLGQCTQQYKDIDGLAATGCEYKCPKWPPAPSDDCDGVDSDCDGQVDEDFAAVACGPSKGQCVAGKTTCSGGYKVCAGGTKPKAEACNNLDDDCDGKVDEDFNKVSDPRYCGGCKACSLMNAIASCVKGVCGVAGCKNGFVDLDKKPANGCEYGCTITGPEICDGADNDCDGLTDGQDPSMLKPSGNYCLTTGACKGASMTCKAADGWICSYGSGVELKPCKTTADCGGVVLCTGGVCPGIVNSEETLCDKLDNDCDGLTDEAHKNRGKPCAESGKQGICQGTGTWVCNAAKTATTCKISKPGVASTDELCNGKDDDCDGKIDEEANDAKHKGVVDSMVHIKRSYLGKSYNFYVYTYEASRPDAGASSAGSLASRACSKKGALPWSNVTHAQAAAACKAAGKRLCSPTEWFLSCSGAPTTSSGGRAYPYGNSYKSKSCNGKDYSSSNDAVLKGGAASGCKSYDGAMDMSGNLKEWTDDPAKGSTAPEQVRGGAYDNVSYGLTCDFTFVVMPKTYHYPNLGFRCCSSSAP